MVEIPNSRNVAYSGTRSGRSAPNGPAPQIGAAIADAGQNIVRAAFNLNDLATQEKVDVLNDTSWAASIERQHAGRKRDYGQTHTDLYQLISGNE